MAQIDDYIQVIDKIADNQEINFSDANALSGIGAMKFLLNDWNNITNWTETDKKVFDKVQQFKVSLKRLSDIKNVKYEEIVSDIKNAIISSYYTPLPIVELLCKSMATMKQGALNILEPSAGTGRFTMELNKQFPLANITAIEKSYLSSLILKDAVSDNANITARCNVFENLPYANKYDLIVSNIPFGKIHVFDEKAPAEIKRFSNSLHGFFFAKGVQLLEDNGVMCFITSTGVLDAKGATELRQHLMEKCNLINVIRLPDNVFKQENTSVTSDIVILQRNVRKKKKDITVEEKFFIKGIDQSLFSEGLINQYLEEHPNNVLGKVVTGNQYGEQGTSVVTSENLNWVTQRVADILNVNAPAIAKEIIAEVKTTKVEKQLPNVIKSINITDGEREGNIILRNDKFYKVCEIEDKTDKIHRVEEVKFSKTEIFSQTGNLQLRLFITLRELTKKIQITLDAGEIEELQQQLNVRYDEFTSQFGYLKDFKVDDIDLPLVKGLELIEDKKVEKADIFSTKFNEEQVYENFSLETAINSSLSNYGKLNINYVSSVMNLPKNDIIALGLETDIFRYDPLSTMDDNIVLKNEFLSGYVEDKINALRELYKRGEEYLPHNLTLQKIEDYANELLKVKPKHISIEDIQPQFGETLIPLNILENFVAHYVGMGNIKIRRNQQGLYNVEIPKMWEFNYNKKLEIKRLGIGKCKAVETISSFLIGEQKFFTYKGADEKQYTDTSANIAFDTLQKNFFQEWDNYVLKNKNVKEEIERLYNYQERYVNKVVDGKYLNFDETERVLGGKLHDHQRRAVAFNIENNGAILDHPVGAGKTVVMINSAIKMKEAGIIKKPLIVGIKSNIEEIYKTAKEIYPNKKILYAVPKDFTPAKRIEFLSKVANNNWDLIVMSHSQLNSIPLNNEAAIAVLEEDIEHCMENIVLLKDGNTDKRDLNHLEKKKENLQVQINILKSKKDNTDIDIVKMGVDHLFIDEAHLYKNLGLQTTHTRVAGISLKASDRAKKLYITLTAIRNRYYNGEDKGFTFVSATPFLNSISEMYILQRLMTNKALKDRGLANFDSWARRYIKISTDLEMTVKGTYVFKPRFREFIKVDTLMKNYLSFTHYVSKDTITKTVKLPTVKNHVHNIEKNPMQDAYLRDVIDFTESLEYNKIIREPKKDMAETETMLIASTQSTLASIDMRLVDDTIYDDYCSANKNTKINILCENLRNTYLDEKENKGTQLIFCDKGVPKGELYNIYNAIREQLSDVIPKEEIAFIHDNETDAKKDELFKKMNRGDIRVIIGSTGKLGTGVNVQERLKAVHHIDIPWRPADFEQRNGRIERQGNTYDEVDINYYVTAQTLDSFKFQVLKFKQHFIDQVRNGSSTRVSNDYEDGNDISYSEMVAEITGNPLIKELAVVTKEIEKQIADIDYRKRQIYSAKATIDTIKQSINDLKPKIKRLESALSVYKQYEDKIDNDKFYTLEDGLKCSPLEFGKKVLESKDVLVEKVIGYVGDTKNFRVLLVPNRVVECDATMRIAVYNDSDEIIMDTAYNYGAIASIAETVGENPIKALKSIYKGLETFLGKDKSLNEDLLKAESLVDPQNQKRIEELQISVDSNQERLGHLKALVSKERVLMDVNNSERIKFRDLVVERITFTDKTREHQTVKSSTLSMNF